MGDSRFFKNISADELVRKLTIKTVMQRSLINEGDRILIYRQEAVNF